MAQDSKKPEKVYYFGTCLVDLFYLEAGLAEVLGHALQIGFQRVQIYEQCGSVQLLARHACAARTARTLATVP